MINPDISKISSIFADKSRAIMLTELLGGTRTTTELAKIANIKPQTATFHLNKMVSSNVLVNIKYGKNSYYKIENEDIAKIIEMLMQISSEPKIKSLKESVRSKNIKFARVCFDHIAGFLAVEILRKCLALNYLSSNSNEIQITTLGKDFFEKIGFNINLNDTGDFCRDWSQKDYHISGKLGFSILENFLNLNLAYQKENSRELILTDKGIEYLNKYFNITI